MSEQELQVQAAVQRVIALYARSMDSRDLTRCLALFAEDATLEVMGRSLAGSAAIRGWMDELAASQPGIHLTTNTVVDASGADEATAVSDVAFIKRVDGAWKIVTAGQYHDRLRRIDSQWRFVSRRIVLS